MVCGLIFMTKAGNTVIDYLQISVYGQMGKV